MKGLKKKSPKKLGQVLSVLPAGSGVSEIPVNLCLQSLFPGEFTGSWLCFHGSGASHSPQMLTNSEFPNGLADLDTSENVTADGALGWDGFTTGIAFDTAGVLAIAGKSAPFVYSETYFLSVFVKMDDGLIPVFGSATPSDASNDFVLRIQDVAVDPTGNVITAIGAGVYRISVGRWATGTGSYSTGVIKYSTNSARTFKVTGYQLEKQAVVSNYVKTTASANVFTAVGSPVIQSLPTNMNGPNMAPTTSQQISSGNRYDSAAAAGPTGSFSLGVVMSETTVATGELLAHWTGAAKGWHLEATS